MSLGFSVNDLIETIRLANDLRKDFVGAPAQFQAISNEIRSLSHVLQDIDVAASELPLTARQQDEGAQILAGCRDVLVELEKLRLKYGVLDGKGGGGLNSRVRRGWKRLTWEPEDVQALRDRVTSNVTLLSAFVGSISSKAIADTKRGVDQLTASAATRAVDAARLAALDWITPADYSSQQQDLLNRRQPGTVQWLLDSPKFRAWLATPAQTLFCPGIPGAGKTITSSVVVDHLVTGVAGGSLCLDERMDGLAGGEDGSDSGTEIAILTVRRRGSSDAYIADDRDRDEAGSTLRRGSSSTARSSCGGSPVPDVGKDDVAVEETPDEAPKDQSGNGGTSGSMRDSVGIAYVYCNFRSKADQTLPLLLASILRQLAASRTALPPYLAELHGRHQGTGKRPSLGDITASLHEVAALFDRVFIVVDALDECQVADGTRADLLARLAKLQAEHRVNVFATSRFGEADMFPGAVTMEIRATRDDVERYLVGHVAGLPAFVRRDSQLQQEITDEIVKAVDGMFLLAHLHLDSLKGKRSPKALRTAVKSLSTGSNAYDGAYDDAMDRIASQLRDEADLAREALSLITCARTALTTEQLRHALAVEVGSPTLDHDNLSQIEDVVAVCAGLVTVDEESDVIRLVHYTTQEYFERTASRWLPGAQFFVAVTCVSYLSFGVFETGPCATDEAYAARLDDYPLYEYATRNWGYHHAQGGEAETPVVDAFLDNAALVSSAAQMLLTLNARNEDEVGYQGWEQWQIGWARVSVSGLHLAARFDLKTCARRLLRKTEADVMDTRGRTPLWWATFYSHADMVAILLDHGASPDLADEEGYTPLLYPSLNGHRDTVSLLLDHGANADAPGSLDASPLLCAAKKNHLTLVKILIQKGASLDLQFANGDTALSAAICAGHVEAARLIVEAGADLGLRSKRGHTALHLASMLEAPDIVKILLDHGTAHAQRNADCETPLWIAALRGRPDTVRLLREHGAELDPRDIHGNTPLHAAARVGFMEVVALLLDDGADANASNHWRDTPTHLAAASGGIATVKLLVARSANLSAKNKNGNTPLQMASQVNNGEAVEIVEELARAGADINTKNIWGDNALQIATRFRCKSVVKALLNMGARYE